MLTTILIFLLVSKTTIAQINGEFWWLNDKVTKLKGVEPSQPQFEELSEFDTDESAKIIFRDDSLISAENKLNVINTNNEHENEQLEANYFKTGSILFPDDNFLKLLNLHPNELPSLINGQTTKPKIKIDKTHNNEDIFVFKYPEDDNIVIRYPDKAELQEEYVEHNVSDTIAKPMPRNDKIKLENKSDETTSKHKKIHEDLFTFKFPGEVVGSENTEKPNDSNKLQNNKSSNILIDPDNEKINSVHGDNAFTTIKKNFFSENICSYMKNNGCYQRNGFIYTSEKANAKKSINMHLICCIVPLPKGDSQRIVFPDSGETHTKRFRRSNKEEFTNRSQRQREFLLEQKFKTKNIKPTNLPKIVTPDDDDYIDPYLNIKSSTVMKSNHGSSKQDCGYQDYVEDYIVELPKPGLLGLYSDNGQSPPWSYPTDTIRPPTVPSYGVTDESEEDLGPSYGFSTIDPRRGTTKTPRRGRPSKLTTSLPEEPAYDIESQTVSFQSTPNFQVLQGFKLLNLGRNKNKFYSKNTRRSTTEGSIESDSKEPEEYTSHSDLLSGNQVYENCGKTRKLLEVEKNDKQFGEAESGSHPWMALVVLTRRPQGILCYATIVHPRAAVTAGDCVYGRTSPKEVILIAGLWNLSDRSQIQNRVVTVQLHPQYRPKVLAHDLAILYWKTPLRLNANIQPACLGNTRDTTDCKFFGWGGFDQGIRTRPRWQRASIMSAQECSTRLGKAVAMPDDAFCATVQTRGTVTGIGGPLICNVNGRKASSGVAIWRDNALVLIPAQEWILRAFQDLNIQ